jgi:hypothetical protein
MTGDRDWLNGYPWPSGSLIGQMQPLHPGEFAGIRLYEANHALAYNLLTKV